MSTDQRTTPVMVGLCPGEHLGEFYMPLDPGESTICPMCDLEMVVYTTRDALATAVVAGVEVAGKVRDANQAERARWVRAFNRLEKAVTNHIRDCIDADGLAHAHKAVMRDVGPRPGALDEGSA